MEKSRRQSNKGVDRRRYIGLDRLRGCILISMILYHGTWDVVYIFGAEWTWFQSRFAHVWQQSICWSFILLSGFCWSLGKRHWKRGGIIFFAGIVITLATRWFMPESIIICGVLTFLGSAMLLMIPLERGLRYCNPVAGMLCSFTLFILTRNVNSGFLGFEQWNWVKLPEKWYANWFTTYLGFMEKGFFSSDYFSLLPWIFLFMTGYFLYRVLYVHNGLSRFDWKSYRWLAWLDWMGKHSLIVYMLHQPVVYGLLMLLWKYI